MRHRRSTTAARQLAGYDQRVEVFGSEGCAEDQNDNLLNIAVLSTQTALRHGVAYKVMWDRYTGASVAEMQVSADAVVTISETSVTGEDGLYPCKRIFSVP